MWWCDIICFCTAIGNDPLENQTGCEEAATGSAGGDPNVAWEEGQTGGTVSTSQLCCDEEDMEDESESDSESNSESCIKGTYLYSLEGLNAF